MRRIATFCVVALLAPTLSGCLVLRSKYRALEAEQIALQAELDDAHAAHVLATGEADAAATSSAELQAELNALFDELDTAEGSVRDAMQQIAEYRRLLAERTTQLEAAMALADTSSSETAELMARLEELGALEAELAERNRLYDDLISRFDALITAGTLDVTFERGRMVINLAQDVLFEAGSAELGEMGVETITSLAGVLSTIGEQELQVEGHSDNVPISTRRFPSNWELSAARALAVVHVLTDGGVTPERLSGAGFAEFRPVADNETDAGRQDNRRIEIVILPDLDALFADQSRTASDSAEATTP